MRYDALFVFLALLLDGVAGARFGMLDRSTRRENTINKKLSPAIWKQLAAGGVSRSLAQMVLYPVDAMRTLKQTRDGRTLRDVGTSALVRGCTTTSLFALFMGSIQFGVFEGCRDYLGMKLS